MKRIEYLVETSGEMDMGLGNVTPIRMGIEVDDDIERRIIDALAPLFDEAPLGEKWRSFRLTFCARGLRAKEPYSALVSRSLLFDNLELIEEKRSG